MCQDDAAFLYNNTGSRNGFVLLRRYLKEVLSDPVSTPQFGSDVHIAC